MILRRALFRVRMIISMRAAGQELAQELEFSERDQDPVVVPRQPAKPGTDTE